MTFVVVDRKVNVYVCVKGNVYICVCLLCEIIIRKSAGLGGRLSVTHGQQPSIQEYLKVH